MGKIIGVGSGGFNPPLSATSLKTLEGATFSVNGIDIIVDEMPDRGELTVTPLDTDQIFDGGHYESITISARPTLTGSAPNEAVLEGETFYRDSYDRETGSMPNRGALNVTPGTVQQTGQPGYYSGITVAGSANLTPENIKKDVEVFGVVGTAEDKIDPPLTADPNHVLEGHTFSKDGKVILTGGMINRSLQAWHQEAADVGVGVHTPNNPNIRVYFRPPTGFYHESWVAANAPTLTPGNIRSGVNIFGVVGNMPSGVMSTGQVSNVSITLGTTWPGTSVSRTLAIPFTPSFIAIWGTSRGWTGQASSISVPTGLVLIHNIAGGGGALATQQPVQISYSGAVTSLALSWNNSTKTVTIAQSIQNYSSVVGETLSVTLTWYALP